MEAKFGFNGTGTLSLCAWRLIRQTPLCSVAIAIQIIYGCAPGPVLRIAEGDCHVQGDVEGAASAMDGCAVAFSQGGSDGSYLRLGLGPRAGYPVDTELGEVGMIVHVELDSSSLAGSGRFPLAGRVEAPGHGMEPGKAYASEASRYFGNRTEWFPASGSIDVKYSVENFESVGNDAYGKIAVELELEDVRFVHDGAAHALATAGSNPADPSQERDPVTGTVKAEGEVEPPASADPTPPAPTGTCTTMTGEETMTTLDVSRTIEPKDKLFGTYHCGASDGDCGSYNGGKEVTLNEDGSGSYILVDGTPVRFQWGLAVDSGASCKIAFTDDTLYNGAPRRNYVMLLKWLDGVSVRNFGSKAGKMTQVGFAVSDIGAVIFSAFVRDCDCLP